MSRTHDWGKMLQNKPGGVLPASCMHLLDTKLTQQESIAKFLDVYEELLLPYYTNHATAIAKRESTNVDPATVNLIATHGRKLIKEDNRFVSYVHGSFNPEDVRFNVLIKLTHPHLTNLGLPTLNGMVEYRKKLGLSGTHPLTTDAGYEGQSAIASTIFEMRRYGTKLLKVRDHGRPVGVLANRSNTDKISPEERAVALFILNNPSKVDVIVPLLGRGITDVEVISEYANSTQGALIEGAL